MQETESMNSIVLMLAILRSQLLINLAKQKAAKNIAGYQAETAILLAEQFELERQIREYQT